ncbi:MAG TPA: orotate phosphoribosyltransferase [Caulobacteraceae bacterium]|nr:orotate phosphoribosyltransferase [Caulobacteraceae bacterium]
MASVARMRHAGESGADGGEPELRELIRARSFRLGTFTLASGAVSDLYFNLKPTMMDPRGAHLAARAFLARVLPEGVDYVGGLEMGAVPMIASLAAISDAHGAPVKTFFVRKEAKQHGTRDVIEGLGPGESLEGARVLIADDVATTGGSIMKAVVAARGAGANVDVALVLVDREEGAAEALGEQGIRLLSVFKGREFR